MLKRGIEGLAGAVLLVVLLALLFPAVAQAQEKKGAPAPQEAVVVSPGDTLWSISEEHLGPGATPLQMAREAERIYALNRDQIGPDPNLIVSGQELSLPAAGGSSADKPATKKTAQAATKGTAKGERIAKGQASDEQANLPKVPTAAAVPTVESLSSDTPPSAVAFAVRSAVTASVGTLAEARTTADGRWLLGWGIIALTFLVGALMAWKLPMRRYTRDEEEVWGIYVSYPAGGYQAYAQKTIHLYGDALASIPTTSVSTVAEPEPASNGSKAQATATEKGVSAVGLGRIAQKRRSQLTSRIVSKRRLLPHNTKKWSRWSSSSAAEAHSAEFRRLLRGAVFRARAARESTGSVRTKTAWRRAESGGGR
jgi:LysM repeat protein